MKAQDWNNARHRAENARNRTIRTRYPDDGNEYVTAVYPIDDEYKETHDGEEQPSLPRFSGCWLGYDKPEKPVDLLRQAMVVLGIQSVEYNTFRAQDQWLMIAVSQQDLAPGSVGRFCIAGITPARTYAEIITDSPLHVHADYAIRLTGGSTTILNADPCFCFLSDGVFTPYYSLTTTDVPPVGARLIWRRRLTQVLEADKDLTNNDYGLISLPVFFHP